MRVFVSPLVAVTTDDVVMWLWMALVLMYQSAGPFIKQSSKIPQLTLRQSTKLKFVFNLVYSWFLSTPVALY